MDANETLVAEIVAKRESAGKPQVAPEPKAKVGRPPKYDENAHPLAAAMLAIAGKTNDEIAESLGIARDTLYDWQSKYEAFSDALKDGKVAPDDEVEAALLTNAKGGSLKRRTYIPATGGYADEFYPPSDTACIFWLCNRRPARWKHVNRVEVTGADGGPIQHADATADTLEAYALEALALVESAERIANAGSEVACEPSADGAG